MTNMKRSEKHIRSSQEYFMAGSVMTLIAAMMIGWPLIRWNDGVNWIGVGSICLGAGLMVLAVAMGFECHRYIKLARGASRNERETAIRPRL